ncbi:transglutaminase-like domain-containing protein [Singulisphaera rosea]
MSSYAIFATVLVTAIPAETAESPRSRAFELTYRATVRDIPKEAIDLQLWLPIPQTDRNQSIDLITIESPSSVSIGREARFSNSCLQIKASHPSTPLFVNLTIKATRLENSGGDRSLSDADRVNYLKEEPLVPLDGPVRTLALEAVRGCETEAEKARALYDTVVRTMKYDKTGIGWGRGDARFACDAKRGNCTDFHALFIGMARSVGLPARFAIGLPLPKQRGRGVIGGYHCWAEIYVRDQGWVPVDASEAAKDPSRRDYFFGHHDEDRLEFTRGRHLTLAPTQQGAPLNFFIYPYAEIDGKPHEGVAHSFTFADLESRPEDPRRLP